MEIINIDINKLKPYKNNPRKNDEAVEYVANSIKEFGFKVPIIVDKDYEIIAGHTRLKAAQQLGLKEVPIIIADDLTEEQVKAFRLADNKVSEIAEWDFNLLDNELSNILDIDMSGFGFDVFEEEQEIIEDDFEIEVPKEPKAKLGDIYQLGNHRLMCGDSTKEEDVAKLMNNERAKILFTSPPYSDMREYNGGKDLSVSNIAKFIKTFSNYAEYQCINLGIQRKEYEIIQYWDEYIKIAKSVGYKLMAWNVWDKMTVGSIGQQKAFFPIRHEWIFVFGNEYYEINKTWEKKEENIIHNQKPRLRRQKDGTTKYSSAGITSDKLKQMESVQQIMSEHGEIRHEHPATFPVQLPSEYIKSMTNEGDNVIEPFGGSGSTLIACEQLNRKCYMMELDPLYCDVIINRWETFTGKEAILLDK